MRGMPQIGFGTWPLRDQAGQRTIEMALELGFRHIDTAQMYGNEDIAGAAIAASGLQPDEVFLTTKIHPDNASPTRLRASAERSRATLGRDIDLLLLHWPPAPEVALVPILDALAGCVDGGIARSIGVSNFTTEMMRVTKKHLGERVKVNQVEFHPVLNQAKVLACSREIDLPLVAYSPLARGRATALPAVHQVARSLGRPASAVVLRWILQCGVKLVVKSERRERCAEFLQAPEFELSRVQMEAIGAESHANFRVVDHVPWKPQWD